MPVNLVRCTSNQQVNDELAKVIQEAVDRSTGAKFTIGLSGGSLPQTVAAVLPRITTDWKKWVFFFCDERVVPYDDKESTFGVYKQQVLNGTVPIKEDQFVVINPDLPAKECALDYEAKVRQHFPGDSMPVFDLLLLGMGPDGHTASLFPGHPLCEVKDVLVAPITDSPKPPPTRVTLTFPVINNAKYCVFVCLGDNKAEKIKEIFADKADYPAARVNPPSGQTYWIIDSAAASKL